MRGNKSDKHSASKNENGLNLASLASSLMKIEPELLVVFGSCLTKPETAGDIDILVVSERFEDVFYQDRRLLLPAYHNGKKVDAQCFTSKEFRFIFESKHPLMNEIRKKHLDLIGVLDDFI